MPTKTAQQLAAELDEMSRKLDTMSRHLAHIAGLLSGKVTA